MERNSDKRPLLYHRWGGLGNHRYQIGFSGDATISWESLDFQPYFTATASNVLYGYWSHDIGGHLGDSIDPEMYTRWLQYGGFSPVMRTHSSKNGALNKEPWVFDTEYTDVIRQAVRQRYEMAPYIYTMARVGYDDGIALCRPMYYDYPEAPEAYSFRSQYMFGDDMLIAPVTKAGVNGYAAVDVWLPEGKWYELHSGTLLDGGKVVTRHFALDEYGVYVKAGSVLPFYEADVNNLNGNDEDITVAVFPGCDGDFRLYEDAGNDKDYATKYAFTGLSNSWNCNVQTVKISPREGSYEGMPAERNFKVKVYATAAPESVTVNGVPIDYEYLATGLTFTVDVPVTDCATEKVVEITYASENPAIANGLVGLSRRMARSIEALKFRTGVDPIDDLAMMGTINEAILYSCEDAKALAELFMTNYQNLPSILAKQPRLKDEDIKWFLEHCGWNL
jgi:alpha-glucosidase (family GH31 glycosyl hydrolase)